MKIDTVICNICEKEVLSNEGFYTKIFFHLGTWDVCDNCNYQIKKFVKQMRKEKKGENRE